MNTNTIPVIPRFANFASYNDFKAAVTKWEESFQYGDGNLLYSVSLPQYNKETGRYAAMIVATKQMSTGQRYISHQITSASLWEQHEQAYAAGWRAIQHLKETGQFPDMTKEW